MNIHIIDLEELLDEAKDRIEEKLIIFDANIVFFSHDSKIISIFIANICKLLAKIIGFY